MADFLRILKESGALMHGHTAFKNGFHGNGWVEKGFVIRHPGLLDQVASAQAADIAREFGRFDVLIGPATSGCLVAAYIARHLNVSFAVTMGKGVDIEFHRLYKPDKNLKVVFVEDLVFSGTDLESNIAFLQQYPFDLLGCSTWISRRDTTSFGVKTISLAAPIFEYFKAEECPHCARGEMVVFDGVRE